MMRTLAGTIRKRHGFWDITANRLSQTALKAFRRDYGHTDAVLMDSM
jgi:hypothetical protein